MSTRTLHPTRTALAAFAATAVALSTLSLPGLAHAAEDVPPIAVDAAAAVAAAPVFTRQPEAVTAEVGQTFELVAEASNANDFRWQRATEAYDETPDAEEAWEDLDEEQVPRARTDTLAFTGAVVTQSGTYRVLAAGEGGETASEAAKVLITESAAAGDAPAADTAAETASTDEKTDGAGTSEEGTTPIDGKTSPSEKEIRARDTQPEASSAAPVLRSLLGASILFNSADNADVAALASTAPADAPGFPAPRSFTYLRASLDAPAYTGLDADVLYGGDLLRIAGGGVSNAYRANAPEQTDNYRPYFAWRWSGEEEWTLKDSAITSATTASRQRADVTVPSLSAGSAAQSLTLEFAVVYQAIGELPQEFVHYERFTFAVEPPYVQPEPLEPTITQPLRDVTVTVGQPATFAMEFSGYPLVSMNEDGVMVQTQEWQAARGVFYGIRNGQVPAEFANVGAGYAHDRNQRTSSFEYTIAAVTPEMDGMTVEFQSSFFNWNGNGWPETIGTATLHVTDYTQPSEWAAPTVETQPESLAQAPDSSGVVEAILTSTAVGSPVPSIQWQRMLPGRTWEDLTLADNNTALTESLYLVGNYAITQAQSGVQFRAKWANRLGTVYSDPATITLRGELSGGWLWGDSDLENQYLIPAGVETGALLTLEGRSWKNKSLKNTGSLITVRMQGVEATSTVLHPTTKEPIDDPTVLAVAKANSAGYWKVSLPLPEGAVPGDVYTVELSSGELVTGDSVRREAGEVQVWATAELATITEDLPDTISVTNANDGGVTVSVLANAPTPISYEWQYRGANDEGWTTELPNPGYFKADGNSLTVPPIARAAMTNGGHVRLALTTVAGTVYSQAAEIVHAGTDSATLSYDVTRDYLYGDVLTVSGSGFQPSRSVYVFLGDRYVTARSDAEGNLSASITLAGIQLNSAANGASVLPPGTYTIVAYSAINQPTAVGAAFTVGADAAVAPPVLESGMDPLLSVPEGTTATIDPVIVGENVRVSKRLFRGTGGSSWGDGPLEIDGDLAFWDGARPTVYAWNAGGYAAFSTEVDVIPADGSPSNYAYVTGVSEGEDDTAVVWVEQDVEPGGTARVSGTGWQNAAGNAGSVIALKLNYKLIDDETGQYERTGSEVLTHPLNGSPDSTIWALVTADSEGRFFAELDLPEDLSAGQKLSVAASSGVFANNDVSRMIVTPSLIVSGVAYEEPPVEIVVCTPSTSTPGVTVAAVPSEDGTLQVSGTGWCNARTGGSVIAIKIDDGQYSHLTDELHSNRTIWEIVEADDETGDWSIDLTLPNGTGHGANGSTPAFGDGEHWLRFLTGSLKEYDPIRTYGTPMGYPTSFVVGEYRPNALPQPIDIDGGQLSDAQKNGVVVTQQTSPAPGKWLVTVPGGTAGDWVYVDAYAGSSARGPFPRWYQLDSKGQVALSLAGVTLQTGELKVTVQSGNQGRVGELLGWAPLTISAPQTATVVPQAPSEAPRTVAGAVSRAASGGSIAPSSVPAAPVKRGSQLTTANVGPVTGVIDGGIVTLSLAEGTANQWIYAYVYTGVQIRPIGWVQLDENRQLKVDISDLPDGNHKIALVGVDGSLIGWASAAKGKVTPAALQQQNAAEAAELVAQDTQAEVLQAPNTPTWLPNVLLGAGVLLLGGAVAAGVMVRKRRNEA